MVTPREGIPIGTHTLFIEDDMVLLVQVGNYQLEDTQRVNEHVEKVLYGVGRAYVIVNQERAGATSGEARRCLAEWNKHHKISGAAIFGGSTLARAAASLALSVIQFIRPEPLKVAFFSTEKEARAWVSKQRDLLGTKKL